MLKRPDELRRTVERADRYIANPGLSSENRNYWRRIKAGALEALGISERENMRLFDKMKATENGITDLNSGEVLTPPREIAPDQLKTPEEINEKKRITNEARAALGMTWNSIDTRDKFLSVMRRRAMNVLEYVLVYDESQKILERCLKEIQQIDAAYGTELRNYFDCNKPEGKKTLTSIYGELGSRAVAESLALPDNPTELQKFNAWVATRDPNLQKELGIVPRTEYDRDMDKIKDYWKRLPLEERAKIPLRLTKAHESFTVRPSIDTIKDTARKEPQKYVSKFGSAINGDPEPAAVSSHTSGSA